MRIPPRDLILLAIFRILPRRSFELAFFGVVDDDERFLLLDGAFGVVAADDLETVEGRSFFRLISVDEASANECQEEH